MKKNAFRLVLVSALLLVLAVSCGEDPFFHSVTLNSQNKVITEQIVQDGDIFTLPEAPKGNGVFKGWLVEGNLKQPGEIITVTKALVITAKWDETQFTITYSPNYGDEKEVTKSYYIGESVVFTTPEGITKDGFVVDGWYTDSSFTGTFYKTGSTIELTESITLYAHWVDKNIDVDIDETTKTASVKIKESEKASATEITIPDSYDGYKVTAVSANGFKGCSALTSVMFGSNVTAIGESAFEGCSALTSITIPSTVTTIGDNAFKSSGLTSLTIDNKENSISGYENKWGSSVSMITWLQLKITYYPNGGNGTSFDQDFTNGSVTLNDGSTFSKEEFDFGGWSTNADGTGTKYTAGSTVTFTSNQSLYAIWIDKYPLLTFTYDSVNGTYSVKARSNEISGEITIPSTYCGKKVTVIEDNAFSGCSAVTKITVGDNVTTVGTSAFSGCTGLTSVDLKDVTSVGDSAFTGCTKLTGADLSSVTTLGGGLFYGCTSLSSVTLPTGITEIKSVTVGSETKGFFENCTSLTAFTLPSTLTTLGNNTFKDSGLTSFTVPSGITTLGSGIFSGCTGLTSLTISSGVTTLSASMFAGCTGLTTVTIPASVTTISDTTFNGCTGLATIRLLGNGDTFITVPTGQWGASNATVIKVKAWTITYKANGGEGTEPQQTYMTADSVTLSSGTAFSMIEADLLSWNTQADGNGTKYTLGSTINPVGNVTLYAIWQEHYPNLTFTLNSASGTYSVKAKNTKISGEITIPALYDGKKVTVIEDNAFSGCTAVTKITVGDNVTAVGTSAFSGCTGLTSVTLKKVTSVGDSAFSGCTKLTSVDLSSVATLGGGLFYGCTSLTSVTLPTGITELKAVTDGSETKGFFENCTSLTTITLPSTLTKISDNMFNGSGLTACTIPESVTSIGSSAFASCTALTAITIPYSVETIDATAFTSSGLTKISLKKIDDGTFTVPSGQWGATGATIEWTDPYVVSYNINGGDSRTIADLKVYPGKSKTLSDGTGFSRIEATLKSWNTKDDGTGTTYALGSAITPTANITLYAIWEENYPNLTFTLDSSSDTYTVKARSNTISGNITIPALYNGKKVTVIEDNAFSGCTAVTKITVGDNITNVGASAFSGCTALTSIDLKDVTSVGDSAFAGCTKLTGADLSSVSTLGGGLFYGCASLTSVTFPTGITELKVATVGSEARGFFENCTSLTAITLPSTLATIGENTFKGSGLTSFTVPNSVTTIGKNAFASATSLASITFGNGLTTLGEGAFSSCTALQSVTIPSGITNLGSSVFSGCTGLTSLTIADGVTTLPASMFSGCTGLTAVTIPGSVTTIDDTTFSSCNGITTIKLLENSTGAYITVPDGKWGAVNATVVQVMTCTITYDANGGEGTDSQQYETGASVTLHSESATSLKKIEATLKEWNTVADGTGTSYTPGQSYSNISGNITLYAIWNDNYPNLTFTLDTSSDTYSVKAKSNKISGSIVIPETYGGKKVTVIEKEGFYNCDSITSITLPSTITTIEEGAFYDSEGLKEVNIPNGITEIKKNVFRYCSALKSITIPDSVTTIGEYAFAYTRFASFVVSKNITSIADHAFYSCYKTVPTISREACANIASGKLAIANEAFESSYISSIIIENYEGAITVPSGKWGASSATVTWSCKKLTYELDGGLVDGSSTTLAVAFNKGDEITLPSNITKDGYVLDGWYSKAEAKGTFEEADAKRTMSEKNDTTLYAHWVDDAFEFTPVTEGGVTTYTVSDVKSDKTGKAMYTVPSVYRGCKVTAIADGCFSSCTSATKIIIPETVTTIGANAFSGCTALTDVEIDAFKDDVTGSPWGAASEYIIKWQKTGADITITYVGNGNDASKGTIDPVKVGFRVDTALSDGTGFKRIESNLLSWNTESDGTGDSYELGGTYRFSKDITLYAIWKDNYPGLKFTHVDDVEYYIYSSSGEITLGKISGWSVTASDDTLKSTRIPDEYGWDGEKEKVIGIGDNAFSSCTDLTQVEIDCTKLIYIGISAFEDVPITKINLPDGLKTISKAAFKGTKLTSVVIPDTVFVAEDEDADEVFMNCTELKTVKLGSRMRYLMDSYFEGCTSLESITIPDSVAHIQNRVFSYCSSLSSVSFGNGLDSYGLGIAVFSYCTSLKSIVIPEGLTYLGGEGHLFEGCTSLESVTLPSTLLRLYEFDFYGCSSLKSVVLPDKLQDIGASTFQGSGLESITIPSSVTSIGNDAFAECSSLKTVILPSNWKDIGNYMFYNCSSLESITIPSYVTSIGTAAFSGTALKSIAIPESVTYIDDEAFANCSNLQTITLNTYKGRIADSPWGSNAEIVWAKIKLSFNYDGGSYNGTSTTVGIDAVCEKGASVVLPKENEVTKEGYTFGGWYKADGTYCETDADGKYTLGDDNVTLKAYWVENSLTLTEVKDENDVVTGYSVSVLDKSKSSYTIPSVYRGKPVTTIEAGAFSSLTSTTAVTVTVPESVTSIASDAFSGYTGIINLNVENDGTLTGSPWGAASTATINWKTTGENN